jgi:hypothetical protein
MPDRDGGVAAPAKRWPPKTKMARRTFVRRAKVGGWSSPRSLSRLLAFGALAFAGRKLPDATPRGMRRFQSHGGTAPAVSGWGLLSEASLPGSTVLCRERDAGQGADTPTSCGVRVGTVATGTAPAFGRALAPWDGSDLLPLRLPLPCSWVTWFVTPPNQER